MQTVPTGLQIRRKMKSNEKMWRTLVRVASVGTPLSPLNVSEGVWIVVPAWNCRRNVFIYKQGIPPAIFKTMKQALEESGLAIEEIKVNSFFSKKPVLNKLMQKLARLRPSLFALMFVVKAKTI